MKSFLLVLLMLTSISIACTRVNTNSNSNNLDTTEVDTSLTEIDTGLTDTRYSPSEAKGWRYSSNEDKMTSKKTYVASIEATEPLEFDFPYDGGSIATLVVRKKPRETDVYITFSKAQLMIDSYEGSLFRVRFDEKPASSYSFLAAADHSSDIAFVENTSRFINNLKKSNKVIVEMEFYQDGRRAIEFNVKGFEWKH